MRKTKFKGVKDDVRPLSQRKGKMNTRKGMKYKVPECLPKNPVIVLPLWGNPFNQEDDSLTPAYVKRHLQPGESETKGDLTQPDYLIKGDIA